ncbi:MAG: bifunctional (p)ppGpp synthetase/guanosine-3',5'-bis(diphosphate) 3'-pyrophosphohydrolase [Rothia sp. (in: high G+C Gram-positive bacteria)]|nr:bifunctional (p)ppGpp synthetase/guanosine-3',5'-bis(diphosphate) 3'-pyrophosphohydrolase [Rothia sp. (in: high G+C Gram-positive bacteria)]
MSASGRVPTRLVFGREKQDGPAPRFSPVLAPLIRAVKKYHPDENLEVLQKAFEVANHYHRGQKRKSGDPYITHPVAVTTILAEIGATGPVLVAGLLHDTVEDTDYTQEQLTADFGQEVAYLVDGVTKLDKVSYGENAPIETIRKLVLSMSKDIRVLLIKLADRLHNARTWRFVSGASAAKKAEETLQIYAPLAHRLGLNTIKWELEDLSFAAMSPDIYREIVRMVGERTPALEKYLAEARSLIQERMDQMGLVATVTGRPKHYYSIHQKMKTKGKSFDEINDILAVRVLVETEADCYTVLGHVMSLWPSVPGRFKDYIKQPKNNHYQSLHMTVNGPAGLPLEIQIRTFRMHEEAEYGVAAHWRYKAASRGEKLDPLGREPAPQTSSFNIGILQSISEISSSNPESTQFYQQLAETLETDEIVVFTPQGKPISLPAGATPVDFAYAIHTEVGDRTVGAKVNGRLVPLHTVLETAQTIEIITTKDETHQPSEDWLKFVRTSKARTKIRQHYAKGRRLEAMTRGRDKVIRAMRQHELPLTKMMTADLMLQVAVQLHKHDVASLYHAVGEGELDTQTLISQLVSLYYGEEEADQGLEANSFDSSLVSQRRSVGDDNGVLVPGAEGILTKIARCCTPVPPDEIVGIVTRLQGISVHRTDCPNVLAQKEDPRQTEVQWAPAGNAVYRVSLQVEGIDRKSLLSDTIRVISEAGCNIVDAKVHTSDDRYVVNRYTIELADRFMLDHLLNQIRNVPGIYMAYRLTGSRRVKNESDGS